jgi:FMN phosphatase YigB (HAD superfamily)
MKYNDLDPRKKGFIFELDNVLFPEKDYLFQVYYLFAGYLEYTEMLNAGELVSHMTLTFENEGKEHVFDALQRTYQLDEKYRFNFNHLMINAKLPLKLLIYQPMINFLQEIVIDRKKLFIVTNGDPLMQLNKIKHTEWNGLEKYLTCYFAEELLPKPEPDSIHQLLKDHPLQRRDLIIVGSAVTDVLYAEACGIDYLDVATLLVG